MSSNSPYEGLSLDNWKARTEELIARHPLNPEELVKITLDAWEDIFKSSIGGFHVGSNIFPKPQIMGFFLQELITLKLIALYPNDWRGDIEASDKDLVYIPDHEYSVEIKASSDPRHVYGNRSYGQLLREERQDRAKKGKSGYYLAINFEPFSTTIAQPFPQNVEQPKLLKIRFGWLDHTDWKAQVAATGQQASILRQSEASKLIELYPRNTLGLWSAPL